MGPALITRAYFMLRVKNIDSDESIAEGLDPPLPDMR